MRRSSRKKDVKLAFMIAIALIIALLPSIAYAIGIAPAKAIFDYAPGKMITYTIDIVNNGQEDLDVMIYPKGEFTDNIRISSQMMHMTAQEQTKPVTVYFTMPQSIDNAGPHEIEIVAVGSTPTPSGQKAIVKADIAVISKLVIDVPYPSKYAEARVYVLDTESGKPITASVPLFNKGKEDITSAYAKIEIYDSAGTKIDELETQKTSLAVGKEAKLTAAATKLYPEGQYTAKALVNYDGAQLAAQTTFSIGELSIDIRSLVVDQFVLGQVAKFDILLYNNWNTELKNVYAEMKIYGKDNKLYTDFKTVATDIQPRGLGRLEGYWYTQGVEPGIYNARITLYYANRLVDKEFELEVQPNAIIARSLATGEAITAAEAVDFQKNGYLILIILGMAVVIAVLVFKLKRKGKAAPAQPMQQAPTPAAPVQAASSAATTISVPQATPAPQAINALTTHEDDKHD
jgi:hypothetical protein